MKTTGSQILKTLCRPAGWAIGLAFGLGVASAPTAWAQAANNDNFADALTISGEFGSVNADNSGYTAEANEPSHAGFPAQASAWFKWTAPGDGPVQFETFGTAFDSVLAVYTGSQVGALNFVVANDDATTAVGGSGLLRLTSYGVSTAQIWVGPSLVKFNARKDQTYFLAVGAYGANGGAITLNWGFRSAGVFRFSADQYLVSETDSSTVGDPGGTTRWAVFGARVTVTRVAGSTGRSIVHLETADDTATAFMNYMPFSEDLIFDDWEMSKSITVPVFHNGGCDPGLGFRFVLSNPQLDPLEVQDILPPKLDPDHSETLMTILDFETDPRMIGIGGCTTNKYGLVNFERASYRTREDIGTVVIRVVRPGGGDSAKTYWKLNTQSWNSPLMSDRVFGLDASSDYATPDPVDAYLGPSDAPADFGEPYEGEMSWGQGDQGPKEISIPIRDDLYPEFNEDMRFRLLYKPGEDAQPAIGMVGECTVTILHNDLPAGSLDEFYNRDFSFLTDRPLNSNPGASDVVSTTLVQPDGKSIIAGEFKKYNAVDRNRIVRANVDGSIDTSFDPGFGADAFIWTAAFETNNKVLIGGDFTSYNGTERYRIARLNTDGSLDDSFNPGLGADNTVWAVTPQADGKILVGGAFSSIGGSSRPFLARLNSDGSVDESFNAASVPNADVQAIVVASDGTILLGGNFTTVAGQSRSGVARLLADGTLDPAFTPRTGVNGAVFAVARQPDGRIVIGGSFDTVDLRPRKNIARLNANGTIDETFEPGAGADDDVYTVVLQPDNRILIGGLFSSVNQTRRMGCARLFANGWLDTSFLDPAYNHFAGFCNAYYDRDINFKSYLFSISLQADGNLIVGGSFHQVGGGRINPSVQTNLYDPSGNEWATTDANEVAEGIFGYSRQAWRNRFNVARLVGGDTDGPGNVGFTTANYSIDESAGYVFVKTVRENGTLGHAETTFSLPPRTAGPGVAQTTTDFIYNRINPAYPTAWPSTRNVADGCFGTNSLTRDVYYDYRAGLIADDIQVTIPRNFGIQGDRLAAFQIDSPSGVDVFYLGGDNVPLGAALGRSTAELRINEVDTSPGTLGFASATYSTNENSVSAIITLTRTNGSDGQVTVRFATTNGTAIHGKDYTGRTNTVTFRSGVTVTNVVVPLINDGDIQQADRTVKLYLSNPGGGATLGLTNATLYIVDDDFLAGRLNLTATTYTNKEYDGVARVTVTRSGGNQGVLDVTFATQNGSALSGTHYLGRTNTLHWDDGDSSPRDIDIPLVPDGLVSTNRQFSVRISNPTVVGALGPNALATVTIVNQDAYGNPQFSAGSYTVHEQGGYATVTVVRVGGSSETISVDFSTVPGTAVPIGQLANYVPTNGTLTFGPGEVARSFSVQILNDDVVDPSPFFFTVGLAGLTPAGAALGTPTAVPVYILDAQSVNEPAGSVDPIFTGGMNDDVYSVVLQPDGRILAGGNFTTVNGLAQNRMARLLPDGTTDFEFLVGLSGANAPVRAILTQQFSNGTRIVVGGAFTQFNGVNRKSISRLNYDGALDSTFNPGAGADGTIYALAESYVTVGGARRIYAAGAFNTFNGVTSPGIVRINDSGTVDTTFNVGVGADGVVYALAVYPTNTIHAGKIVIGGSFLNVNGVPRARIARLNLDGSLDTTFNPGTGADDVVRAVALERDGRVLAGGAFTHVNETNALNRLARFNLNGSVDAQFKLGLGSGFNDLVYGIAIEENNRIVVVGDFARASGVSRSRITRLLPDGSVDPSINFGAGANAFIAALAIQSDGRYVIGGGFTQVQGETHNRIARLYGRSRAGSGQLEFDAPIYVVDENVTNAVITVRRIGGTSGTGPTGADPVTATFTAVSGTAIHGVNFYGVTNTLVFPLGEVMAEVVVPVLQDFQITPDLTVNLAISDVSAPAETGPQPTAVLKVMNVDNGISFDTATLSRNEDAIDGFATVEIVRTGSTRGTSAVLFTTTTNGTAVVGVNYQETTNLLVQFLPGESRKAVKIPVLHNPVAEGDKTVTMELNTPINALLFNPFQAVLTIVDVDRAPGELRFASALFVAGEGDGNAVITVVRTNGRSGVVSVNFATTPGTATPGLNYFSTNGLLTFADGEFTKSFAIRLLDDPFVTGEQTVTITLSDPSAGATLGSPSSAILAIQDNDVGISFSSPAYVISEREPAVSVNVMRLNATNQVSTVDFTTQNGTALAGTNYGSSSGTLTFGMGETVKFLSFPILRDPRVTGNLTFSVLLTNASGGVQLVPPNPATVVIVDADTGFSFANAAFSVSENATNLLVTVLRSNANSGTATVNYATEDDTAVDGIDYVSSSGALVFTNGEALKTLAIQIKDNAQVQDDRAFRIRLFNPSVGGQLMPPAEAVVTISDNDAGLRFSSAAYSLIESSFAATINVVRSNFTNSVVSVGFTTEDGTGIANLDYFPTNGTLLFTNGEVSKTFTVRVVDDNVVKGNRTVLLKLLNPVGDTSIVNPGAATLTIFDDDGSLIVAAGSALLSETNGNDVIDPGEPVTILFGLRNSAGTNALNVTATLLDANGVKPTTVSQVYGALPVGGPAVSRPFSFRAVGTNGQSIAATLSLKDGLTDLGVAVFNYTIGTTARTFSNNAAIAINDATGTPVGATPYPATINVSGVDGLVAQMTVTVSNLTHASAGDVGMLLVGPANKKAVLMANAGGFNPVTGATLTFDDTATATLPLGTSFGSGRYKPTTYQAVPPFPAPAPPQPYTNVLSTFTGSNPNSAWSLYVIDDLAVFGGAISNGWSLSFLSVKPVGAAADLSLAMTATPEPVIVTSNVTYTLTLDNHGPSAASAIVVSNPVPANAVFVSATPTLGSFTNVGGAMVWSVDSLATNGTASLSLVLSSVAGGDITNRAVVSSGTFDPYTGNNSASVVSTVITPEADLVMEMNDAPDPVTAGYPLTYVMGITNRSRATSVGVTVTNNLPAGVAFVSVAASQGASGLAGNKVWAALGNLGAGNRATVTLVVRPMQAGTLTSTASATSVTKDPLKGNNTASVKTMVEAQLTAYRTSGGIRLVSAGISGSVLESTPSLTLPVVWTPLLTNPPPVVELPITGVNQFFRIRPPSP